MHATSPTIHRGSGSSRPGSGGPLLPELAGPAELARGQSWMVASMVSRRTGRMFPELPCSPSGARGAATAHQRL